MLTIVQPTKPCAGCHRPMATYRRDDYCVQCQERAAREIDRLRSIRMAYNPHAGRLGWQWMGEGRWASVGRVS